MTADYFQNKTSILNSFFNNNAAQISPKPIIIKNRLSVNMPPTIDKKPKIVMR